MSIFINHKFHSILCGFIILLLGNNCLAQEFVVGGYRAYALLGEAKFNDGIDYVSFTGDFGFNRNLPSDKDIERHLAHEADLLSNFKLSVINLEFSLPGFSGHNPDKRIDSIMMSVLTKSGFDLVARANNHAWDQGLEGLRYNERHLDEAGLAMIGTRDFPVYEWEIGDHVIAIYALTDGSDQKDPGKHILKIEEGDLGLIKQQTAQAHFRIAFIHLGSMSAFPSPHEREQVSRLIHAGADLIVCTGTHFIKGFIKERGKPVFYGIGNHLFPSSGRPEESVGLHLVAGFKSAELAQLFVIPFRNTIFEGKTGALNKAQFDSFKTNFLERSNLETVNYFSDPGSLRRFKDQLSTFRVSRLAELKLRHLQYAAGIVWTHYPILITAVCILFLLLGMLWFRGVLLPRR